MNIIITDTFKKDFLKIFKWKNDIFLFSKELRKTRFINLKNPFQKYKLTFSWISIRWILLLNIANNCIPLYVVKKSNKKYWMNLVLDKELEKILENKYFKIKEDINNDDFEIY